MKTSIKIIFVGLMSGIILGAASGTGVARESSEIPQKIEIFSAGKRFHSMSAYRQYQLNKIKSAIPLQSLKKKYLVEPDINEVKKGKDIFVKAQEVSSAAVRSKDIVLGISDTPDIHQLEEMLEVYRRDHKIDTDFHLDPAKIKTIVVDPAKQSEQTAEPAASSEREAHLRNHFPKDTGSN